MQALPPLHEIAAMSGVNLPSYLGDLQKKDGAVDADLHQE